MDPLLLAYQASLNRLRLRAAAAAVLVWDRLGSWNEPDAMRFAETVIPVVTAAQSQAVALTDAYLSIRLGEQPVGLNTESLVGAGARRGAAPDVVYRRPFVGLWQGLGEQKEWVALAAGAKHRIAMTARTDVQLASRGAAQQRISGDQRVVGYRRVLTGLESCGFCAVATTQRYGRAQLLPLHPGCDCTVEPIIGTSDPGRVINRERLDELYAEVEGSTDRSKLSHITVDADGRPVLPEVVEIDHGELGPTLADASHHHTSL